MTFKKIAMYTFIALLIISSCSCSFNTKTLDTSTGTKNNASTQLSMSYHEGQEDFEKSILLFEIQNPGIRIEAKPIVGSSSKEFGSNLITQLYAGEGPDIILFDDSYFNLLYKSVNSGVFYDLNKLIKNDTELNNV